MSGIGIALVITGIIGMIYSLSFFWSAILFFIPGVALLFYPKIKTSVREKKEKKQIKKMQKEVEKIPPLEIVLRNNIVGQEEAAKDITKTISLKIKKAERKGIIPRILGTFMFVGPTGVGKTETAKITAEWFYYKFGHQFLRFDMGNFSDYHTAATLVGSPKGYIGSEEGGALTRPLMQNPKAVMLFDELEKAHPSLYKTFMSMIDEGELQEISTGIRVVLNQSVIIFTSNLYQKTISEISKKDIDEIEKEMIIRDVLTGRFDEASSLVGPQIIEEDLRKFTGTAETMSFPPEFTARIDKIVVFKPLNEYNLLEIVFLVAERNNIKIRQDEASYLVNKFKTVAEKYGVRVFIKKIEEELL